MADPGPGTTFGGDFELLERIAAGGMGVLYRARQRSTGADRALKLMNPGLLADAGARERFKREAVVGSRIASEHVVHVIAAGIDDATGAPWMAMELLEGEDLARHMRRVGRLSPRDVHDVFEELVHGLGAAHDAGVVHRDLKPENVFLATAQRVGRRQVVKILDFGIAKVLAESGAQTAALGTPLWMAPEQAGAGGEVGPPADVWAMGLIAFWLLTGKSYWRPDADERALNVAAVMAAALFSPIEPPTRRAASVRLERTIPPGFDDWFLRCVARDPAARYAHARAAGDALLPILLPRPKQPSTVIAVGEGEVDPYGESVGVDDTD